MTHGAHGYRKKGCRCDTCRAGKALEQRRRSARQRARGIKPPARYRYTAPSRRKPAAPPPEPAFPADRIRPIVQAWIENYNAEEPAKYVAGSRGGITELAARAHVGERNIRRLLNGETEVVLLRTVDRLLCGMDRLDLFHTALADIYEAEAA